jgi:hypothetical protein
MNAEDYGKLTFIIMNQEGMTAQVRLDLIYKSSLLLGEIDWLKGVNPKIVLTQEVVTQVKPLTSDFSDRIN